MALLWKRKTGVLHTIGIDGLTTAVCEKVFLVSESFGSMVSFKDLVSQDENRATGEYMAELMIDALKNGTITAGGNESDVEEYYAAIVADNASANLAGAKIMESRYPHVFFNGCRSHCTDLLCEDICSKIPEIKEVIDDAHNIAKVVQQYATVKAAFQ